MKVIKEAIKKNKTLFKFIVFCVSHIYQFIRVRHLLYATALFVYTRTISKKIMHRYSMMGVKAYCIQNQLKITIVEEESERLVCTPKYFGLPEAEQTYLINSPALYIADLYNVDILGANSIITKDQYCLYDMFEIDTSKRYDFAFSSIKSISKTNKVIILSLDTDTVIEEAIFLLGFGSSNYFHFTIELMSKLKYIDRDPSIRSLPILIDEAVLEIPQFKQFLQVINIHDRQIIPAKKDHRYRVKRLVFPSDCSWMPINIKSNTELSAQDFRVSEGNLRYVRDTILEGLNIEKSIATRKIFISRKSQYSGRLINEVEVSSLFQQHGYEVIYPEDLSFEQQVKVFSEAQYIAGVSGAGMTNIVYCSPGATFICIIPQKYKFDMYSTIAKIMNLKSIFLDAQIVHHRRGEKSSSDKFMLPIDYCRAFLEELEMNQTGVAK